MRIFTDEKYKNCCTYECEKSLPHTDSEFGDYAYCTDHYQWWVYDYMTTSFLKWVKVDESSVPERLLRAIAD